MKVISWDRLGIDVNIKELSEDECREILHNKTYRSKNDYKFFVVSKALVKFPTVVQHVRLYSASYGVLQTELLDDLYKLVISVNPLLTTKGANIQGNVASQGCSHSCAVTEEKQEETFEKVSKEDILSLGNRITKQVVGQSLAVENVVLAIQRSSAGLRDPEQPIGSFLLTGPTGVGKTYFAKILAKELIGKEANLIRIDCSEYQARHEVSKLIGAPHGYIGFEQGGVLTNAINARPFSIVLFDEVEKAHDTVFNLLLQIMDEGLLTANIGTKHSFSQSVILMTSNLGVDEAGKAVSGLGFGAKRELSNDDRVGAMEMAVRKKFRPEFINRLDSITHFMGLSKEDCRHIVILELEKLLKFLKENKNIEVVYDEDVISLLHERGFDGEYGARPLRRCIRKDFANHLAYKVLMGEVEEGATLVATVSDGKVEFI
jgi:ATP-dependent Clp protease ATP-binding subunit ClpC